MRHIIPLNYGWKYSESFCEAFLERDCNEEGFEEVDLPHTNKELPYTALMKPIISLSLATAGTSRSRQNTAESAF